MAYPRETTVVGCTVSERGGSALHGGAITAGFSFFTGQGGNVAMVEAAHMQRRPSTICS